MRIIHSDEHHEIVGKSIYLAGPTPRQSTVPSWRPTALYLLRVAGFQGTALVPERHDWQAQFDCPLTKMDSCCPKGVSDDRDNPTTQEIHPQP